MPEYYDGLGNDKSAYVLELEKKVAELKSKVLELETDLKTRPKVEAKTHGESVPPKQKLRR